MRLPPYLPAIRSAREACRKRLEVREGWPRYILNSLTLPLEIILHFCIGGRYITRLRVLIAGFFLWLALLFFGADAEMRSLTEVFNPPNSFIQKLPSEAENVSLWNFLRELRLLPAVFSQSSSEPAIRVFPIVSRIHKKRAIFDLHGRAILDFRRTSTILSGFFLLAGIHLTLNFFADRLGARRQSRYNGDSWHIWDPFYYLAKATYFPWDVAKLILEPALCVVCGILLAKYIHELPEMREGLLALARWLFYSGFIVAFKAFLDDRSRVAVLQDASDSVLNIEAFEAGQRTEFPQSTKREVK